VYLKGLERIIQIPKIPNNSFTKPVLDGIIPRYPPQNPSFLCRLKILHHTCVLGVWDGIVFEGIG
jgi:hypothetical protein